MAKKHTNDGPTFRPGTMKVTRGPAPSPERQRIAEQDLARECEKSKRLAKLPDAARIAFMVKLASKKK